MRCPDCGKFATLETQDPEVSDLEVAHDFDKSANLHTFTVTATVRLVRACAEDGTELKECTFELEKEISLTPEQLPADCRRHEDDVKHLAPAGVEVTEESCEAVEEGGGRFKKSFFGVHLNFSLQLGTETFFEDFFEDKVSASSMDEM